MDLTDRQLEILTYTVLGEAAGDGYEGMAAVAHVIRNRAEDGRFSSDPARVAKQGRGGVYQFSTWNAGEGGNNPVERYSPKSKSYKTAEQAILDVFGGEHADPTGGATHYWSPRGMRAMGLGDPYWADDEATAYGRVVIGGHVFLARHAPTVAPTPAKMSAAIAASRVRYDTKLFGSPFTLARGLSLSVGDLRSDRLPDFYTFGDERIAFDRTYDAGNRMSVGGVGALLGAAGVRKQSSELVTRTVRAVRVDAYGTPISDVQWAANEAARRLRDRMAGSAGNTREQQRLEQLLYAARPSSRGSLMSSTAAPLILGSFEVTGSVKMPGVIRTANAIAGTVQLPRDVVPATAARDLAAITRSDPVKAGATWADLQAFNATRKPTEGEVEAATGFRFSERLAPGQTWMKGGMLSPDEAAADAGLPPVSPLVSAAPKGPARGRGAAGAAKRALAARAAQFDAGDAARRQAADTARQAALADAARRRDQARIAAQRAAEQRRVLMRKLQINSSPAALAAALQGRTSYVGSGGGLVPLYAPGGGLRNTYGDAANGIGASLVGSGGIGDGENVSGVDWW